MQAVQPAAPPTRLGLIPWIGYQQPVCTRAPSPFRSVAPNATSPAAALCGSVCSTRLGVRTYPLAAPAAHNLYGNGLETNCMCC